jgi:mRNA interferase HigB
MQIIRQKKSQDFAKKHADAINSISIWRKVVQDAN